MKKLLHLKFKSFRRYLFSYLSVVLILLSILSIFEMWRIAVNMKRESIRLMETKLSTIVEYLEIQTEAMERMVVEIASMQEFRLDYFSVNKYREIELLGLLDNYQQTSDLYEQYFIKYFPSDTIFTSGGNAAMYSAYLSSVLHVEERDELKQLLDTMCLQPKESLEFYAKEDVTFFLYPLREYAYREKGMEGVLCFQVSEKSVLKCIQKFVGNPEGSCVLYYKDICLLKQANQFCDPQLEIVSASGDFVIQFWFDDTAIFSWRNVFSPKEIVILVGLVILLLLIGVIGAYWNYIPIIKVIDKYKDPVNAVFLREWSSLDILLESLLQGKKKDDELLKKQRQMLKEQTIRIIATGGYSERRQEYLTLLNIKLPGPVFAIINCNFEDIENVSAYEKLNEEIEELSGDGLIFYAYCDKGLKVLISAEEEYQLKEAVEKLVALFDALEFPGSADIICIGDDLRLLHANTIKNIQKDEEVKNTGDKNAVGWKALEYIKGHCAEYDLSLDRIAEKFQITAPYLCYIIKEQTGVSYKKYLTELRMAEAKRLLKETDLRVIDVSQKTGYNDVSYFIKVFQRYTGMTPAKYREED